MSDQKKKIWAVDDNQADLDLLDAVFDGDQTIHLQTFSNAKVALDELTACAVDQLPDLLLLDINMPGFSGVQFLSLIKEEPRLQHLRVYVLTGSAIMNEHGVMQALGAQSVLQKPRNFHHVIEVGKYVRAALSGETDAAQSILKRKEAQ